MKPRSDDDDLQMRERVLVALGVIDPERRYFPGEARLPGGGHGGGEWTSGGGGGAGKAAKAIEDALKSVEGDLVADKHTTIDPQHIDALMGDLKGKDATNLVNLHVNGKGNEALFDKPVSKTPRSEMPQLPSSVDTMKPFIDRLAKDGIKVDIHPMDPTSLKAYQAELDSKKVAKMYGFMKAGGWQEGGLLIVSRDGVVVDGHHRWAGAAAVGATGALVPPPPPHKMQVTALQVDMNIADLMPIAQEMSGARVGLGTENAT